MREFRFSAERFCLRANWKLLGLFCRLKINVSVNNISQIDAVEQIGRLVADLKHQRARAAIFFLDAIFARFVRITARARNQRQRSAHDADQIAIADVDR